MGRGSSKAGTKGGSNGSASDELITSGNFRGITRGDLQVAIQQNVEREIASLNNKYALGNTVKVGGKEYTVTKEPSYTLDEYDRINVSFTLERTTKAEKITTTYKAIILRPDGVNAAKLGSVSHKETREKIKNK